MVSKKYRLIVGIIIFVIMGIALYLRNMFKKTVETTATLLAQSGTQGVTEVYLSDRNLARLINVDVDLVRLANEVTKRGLYKFNVGREGGFRTAEQQNVLYLDGKSQRDGYNDISNHQLGRAMDLYPVVNTRILSEKYDEFSDHILDVANELDIKITWGGSWTGFRDKPHYELK